MFNATLPLMQRWSKRVIFATASVICLTLALYIVQPRWVAWFEARAYDLRIRSLQAEGVGDRRIAIVAIDDKSLAELGRFPWTRDRFSRLLSVAKEAGAKGVLLDVLFPEAETADVDKRFAKALRDTQIATLANAFDFDDNGDPSAETASLPILVEGAGRTAHINLFPDDDGVVRWGKLLVEYDGVYHPSLALAGAKALLGAETIEPLTFGVKVGPREIPTDSSHMMLINYVGPPGAYERYSFCDVIAGRIPREDLAGRVLFVGATALGIYDMRVTPFSSNMPGIEVHANIADNIVRGNFLNRGLLEILIDIVAIILTGVAAAFATLRLRHAGSLPVVLCMAAGYVWLSFVLFRHGHWISLLFPLLTIGMVFAVTAYLRFFFLDRKTRAIRSMFSSYVSHRVVDELVKDPALARVGGESREITVLFADIQNYTGFSERFPPEEVVRILNEYLSEMTGAVMDSEGTLDKFLGDGIMAFWGAPLRQEDHAQRAVGCAVEMLARMERLKTKWERQGDVPLSFRIGINTGEVIVGNVGAEGKKMEYTAIGDNVNLASRVEGLNKVYGTRILVTGETRAAAGDSLSLREIDTVQVKGKERPVSVFEVFDGPKDLGERYAEALALYREGNFAAAMKRFDLLAEEFGDPPSALFAQRCLLYHESPPDQEWDGAYVMTTK